MEPLIRNLAWAFWYDEKAIKRWLRGAASAVVPIAVQLMADKGWMTWTWKEWTIRSIPSLFAFVHGSMLSSATPAPPPEPKL